MNDKDKTTEKAITTPFSRVITIDQYNSLSEDDKKYCSPLMEYGESSKRIWAYQQNLPAKNQPIASESVPVDIEELARNFVKRMYPSYGAPMLLEELYIAGYLEQHTANTDLDKVREVPFAFTYEQLLTLPWHIEFNHLFKPGYSEIDGNQQYFGTSKEGKRIISVNANYCGKTYVLIEEDGGSRKVFNGFVRSFEELRLINSLVY